MAVKMPARMPKKMMPISSRPGMAAMVRTSTAWKPGKGSAA